MDLFRARPIRVAWGHWTMAAALVTVALVALLGRFETPRHDDRPPPPA